MMSAQNICLLLFKLPFVIWKLNSTRVFETGDKTSLESMKRLLNLVIQLSLQEEALSRLKSKKRNKGRSNVESRMEPTLSK